MAESVTLTTEQRQTKGTKAAARLRKTGRIPAVVYGHKEETASVSISAEELAGALRHHARVVDLKSGGNLQKALIRELQWDHLGKDVLHVDFYRVSADERIKVSVALELRGTAPGVTGGGLLEQPLHSLHVECLAIAIPDSIRVNIGELQIGQAIHVSDVKAPEGVVILDDPEAVVVQVAQPKAQAEPTAEAAEEATAEPEVIGRKAEGEEGTAEE